MLFCILLIFNVLNMANLQFTFNSTKKTMLKSKNDTQNSSYKIS